MSWTRPFPDPIPTPKGDLTILKHAAAYILKLPESEQHKPHWQAAAEAVIMAAEERGPILHASVGMRRALNFGRAAPERERRARSYRIVK